MESSTDSFDGILEDLLTIPPDKLEEAIRAYAERFPKYRDRLQKFADDSMLVDRYFTAAKKVGSELRLAAAHHAGPALVRLGRYQVLQEIGRGSQGIIYQAEQVGLARTVALKIILEGVLASAKERLRFENEIQLISRLHHPNIVTIYDCGIEAGRAYFAMEYIDGQRLDRAINNECSVSETLQMFLQIADAVSYAHQHGIIHRDLKPSNILIDSHRKAHILDFGLAKAIHERTAPTITEFGVFTGTWPYASPEQVDTGQSVTDVRSDVYTLGIILFEMLTGALPYPIAGDRKVTRDHILKTAPYRPSSFRGEISDDLDTIVLRALAKESDRRYQSAAELRDDVQRCLRNQAIDAKRDSRWYVLRKTVESYRWQFRAAAAGLAALVVFAVAITWLYAEARRARATTEARAGIVRVGQRYTNDRLRELHILANVVETYKADRPQALMLARMGKPVTEFPSAEVAALGDIPGCFDSIIDASDTEQTEAVEWLRDRDGALDSIASLATIHRFRFPSDEASPWLLEHTPFDAGGARALCLAFAAQAAFRAEEQSVADGFFSLTAARSVAFDLADEPFSVYKEVAMECRLAIYHALEKMITVACAADAGLTAYEEWLLEDPALPSLEHIQLYDRARALQYVEASVESDPASDAGRLNLDRLNQLTNGLYEQVGVLTPETRAAAMQVAPARIVEALDHFTVRAALSPGDREALRFLVPILPVYGNIDSVQRAVAAAKQSAERALRHCSESKKPTAGMKTEPAPESPTDQ